MWDEEIKALSGFCQLQISHSGILSQPARYHDHAVFHLGRGGKVEGGAGKPITSPPPPPPPPLRDIAYPNRASNGTDSRGKILH